MNLRIVSLAIILVLSSSAIAEEQISPIRMAKKHKVMDHPSKSLDFLPFQKETCCLGNPFEYSSKSAESLWKFLVRKRPGITTAWGDMTLRDGGSFAVLGRDSYLVLVDAYYFAQPRLNKLVQLTTAFPPGAFDEPDLRPLPGNRTWALLSGSRLYYGIAQTTFYALSFWRSPSGQSAVSSTELINAYGSIDGPCQSEKQGEHYKEYRVTGNVIKDINGDGLEDIIFEATEEDCNNRRTEAVTRIFINTGTRFVEQPPPHHSPEPAAEIAAGR